jgi:hypothetical protein
MKQITMDFETYKKELEDAEIKGENYGVRKLKEAMSYHSCGEEVAALEVLSEFLEIPYEKIVTFIRIKEDPTAKRAPK